MTNLRRWLVIYPAVLFSWVDKSLILFLMQGILCIAAISSCLGNGYYKGKWLSVCAAFALIICVEAYRRLGLAAFCLLTYLMGSSLWILLDRNKYTTVNPYDLLGIEFFSLESAFKLLLLTVPILLIRVPSWERFDEGVLRALGRMLMIGFILISLGKFGYEWAIWGCKEVNSCGGSLMNPSMNTSMLAVAMPFMAAIPYGILFVIPVAVAAMVSQSAIGMGMLAVFMVIYLTEKRKILWSIPAVPLILYAGWATHGYKEFFNSSGRFQMWKFFMQVWSMNWKNVPFGTGFGTFGAFSIHLQQGFGINPTDWWVWAHNDFIQMAFETGLVGLALLLWVYLTCLKKLYDRNLIPELQSLLLFGVMMGSNYPLHIAPCCAYAAWIVAMALIKPEAPAPIIRYK